METNRGDWLCVLTGLVVAALALPGFLWMVEACGTAPAPPARPPPKAWVMTAADVAGGWTATWCGDDYPIDFCFDGSQRSTWCGQPWEGTWRVTGGELIVEDGTAGSAPSMTWTATLARRGGGLVRVSGTAPDDFALGGRR